MGLDTNKLIHRTLTHHLTSWWVGEIALVVVTAIEVKP